MAKKSSSGSAYVMPSGKPYRTFNNGTSLIKVFYHMNSAEIFQTTKDHTQRLVLTHSDYDNFESKLTCNGFKAV